MRVDMRHGQIHQHQSNLLVLKLDPPVSDSQDQFDVRTACPGAGIRTAPGVDALKVGLWLESEGSPRE